MYNSIADPHLGYCCSVSGCAGDSIIKKLQKLQNRAARIVTDSPNDQSSLPSILQLVWLTVKEMIDFETACTVYKVLKGLAPPYNQSMFQSWPVIETYVTPALTLKLHYAKPLKGSTAFHIEEFLSGIN